MTQIPSEENFSRAKELARERSRNLDNVRNTVMNQFASECPLVDFYILDQIDVDFRVYVFFNKTADAEVCQNNGTSKQIIDFVYKELERAGRGQREQITVAFEFDSDENVKTSFNGDYFLRLR